jgi:hypothetical protein
MNQVFLSGESVDLCVPSEADFPTWASWFNSQKITEFLEQGKFPHTVEMQRDFYFEATKSGRFLALIKTKLAELLGVISLSEINYEKSACQIALVCPKTSSAARFAALEAMSLATSHGFDRFGVQRIYAGQAYPQLAGWAHRLELLGYYADGIFPKEFVHGRVRSDGLRISVTQERYLAFLKRRNGSLWPGEKRLVKMIASLKQKTSTADDLSAKLRALHEKNDLRILEIERDAQL